MKQISRYLFIALLLFFISCSEKQDEYKSFQIIKVTEAKGYEVPKDSISEPSVIQINETKIKKIPAGKPNLLHGNLRIPIAVTPQIIKVGTPNVCAPGQDTFLLPEVTIAMDSIYTPGSPEIKPVKEPKIKDHNPQNFAIYTKFQGLKENVVSCMLQDKLGNIWLGTSGGLTKYDGKNFWHFTMNEGLTSNHISALLQDKSGNIWLGMPKGVIKYDGKKFTRFTKLQGFIDDFVSKITEDKEGNIWFCTFNGVYKYDGEKFYHFTTKQGLSNNIVTSVTKDKNGNLWFGTNGGGLNKYDGIKFTNYVMKTGLQNDYIRTVYHDAEGNLLIGSFIGLSKYDGDNFAWFTEKEELNNINVTCVIQDNAKNYWFGSMSNGIYKYDGKSIVHYTVEDGLSDNNIICIMQDNSGNIWFGTSKGLNKYNGKTFTHYTEKEGLSDYGILSEGYDIHRNLVYATFKDKKGNLWFGNSAGVTKYDGKNFSNLTEKEGLSNNDVRSIFEDKTGNLWFSCFAKGVCKYDGTTISNYTYDDGLLDNIVFAIEQDDKGNLWFGNMRGVSKFDGKSFTNYTTKQGLSHNEVRVVFQDKSGNVWYGTNGGGVTRYDGKSFTHFTIKEGLSNNSVKSIYQDKYENIWIGTEEGINVYNGENFTKISDKDGLSHKVIISIYQDKKENLWIGTRYGLNMLRTEKLSIISKKIKENNLNAEDLIFKTFVYDDGFLGVGVSGKAFCESEDSTLWIATQDRLTAYHPSRTDNIDTIAPNIQLTNIKLFNQDINWSSLEKKKGSTIELANGVKVSDFDFDGRSNWYGQPENLSLAYDNNFLSFNFIGITMSQPNKVKYKFKLEGVDRNWSVITENTEAVYGSLSQGTFTFKVKAMNAMGYWSKPFEYTFTIRPPWWKTWWFRTLVGAIIIGSIILYIKWRERSLKEKQKELETKIDEATFEIKEQKHLIEEKHKEITDSINYAERIQRSFLATEKHLNENLNEYFVLFKPKDVVSGDFYWSATLNNGNFAIATADSTGHGVPGAIMSLLNITSLEKAIETNIEPFDILNTTRKIIIERLKKDGSIEGGKDGMDCSLCVYDFKIGKLYVSAANNPVWIVKGNEVIEIKPDKMPVGKHDRQDTPFTMQEIDLQSGDVVYTLTDGFPDQFGGPLGKKFMSKKLRELLVSNAHLPMFEQKLFLENSFAEWVGNIEQVDDVTVIGIRV